MERELWSIIAAELTKLSTLTRRGRYEHSTTRILRVYLWAVLHDRPVVWACDRRNWVGVKPPRRLPDQSTMSRRMRRDDAQQLLEQLLDRLEPIDADALILRMDGKPLPVARHSTAAGAGFGRGAGGFQMGYKLHAIYAGNGRPVAMRIGPMNVDERTMAKEMLNELAPSDGYILADANYETNPLYDQAAEMGRVLVTPRRFAKAKGLGQSRVHSVHRVEMIERMKAPSSFIRNLLNTRRSIETSFANLTNFGGGLTHLPPWIRSHRVEPYVKAKILIRIVRSLALERRACA